MTQITAPKAPSLPAAPTQYDQRFHDQYGSLLRLYFSKSDDTWQNLFGYYGGNYLDSSYGAFSSTATQTAAVINTAYAVTFDTTQHSHGVAVDTTVTSRVVVSYSGYYNLQFSAQVDKTNASVGNVWLWLRIDGTDVANSAQKVAVQGSTGQAVVSWNSIHSVSAGSFFQLMWAADDTHCRLLAAAASAPVPAIPAATLTLTRVSGQIT